VISVGVVTIPEAIVVYCEAYASSLLRIVYDIVTVFQWFIVCCHRDIGGEMLTIDFSNVMPVGIKYVIIADGSD